LLALNIKLPSLSCFEERNNGLDRTNPALLERADGALDALETIVKRGNGLLEVSEKYLHTITAGIKGVLAAWGVAL